MSTGILPSMAHVLDPNTGKKVYIDFETKSGVDVSWTWESAGDKDVQPDSDWIDGWQAAGMPGGLSGLVKQYLVKAEASPVQPQLFEITPPPDPLWRIERWIETAKNGYQWVPYKEGMFGHFRNAVSAERRVKKLKKVYKSAFRAVSYYPVVDVSTVKAYHHALANNLIDYAQGKTEASALTKGLDGKAHVYKESPFKANLKA